METIHVEKCSRCPRTETYRWHRKKTEEPICNTCHRQEWVEQNPEIARERSKIQNASENSKAARKEYSKTDRFKEIRNKWHRDEYWKDPEAVKRKKKISKDKNPNYYKEYYSKNQAAYHERAVRRLKGLNKANLNGLHLEETIKIYDGCPEGHEVDHIVPLKGKDFIDGKREHVVCGLHVPWNLQYLTRLENRKKGCNLYSCNLVNSEEV